MHVCVFVVRLYLSYTLINSHVCECQQRVVSLSGSWLLSNQLYCTSLCRNKAQHKASHPLTLSLVCACECLCVCVILWVCSFLCVSVYVRRECLQGCQRRFKIFSLLSAPTHFSPCSAAQICKSVLLRMQSTRSASIYSILLSPSLSVSALTLPLCSSPLSSSLLSSPLGCLHSVFGFLFGLSCSVPGICPHWGIA